MKKTLKTKIFALSLVAAVSATALLALLPTIIHQQKGNVVVLNDNLHTRNRSFAPTTLKVSNEFDASSYNNNIDWTSVETAKNSLAYNIAGTWKNAMWDNWGFTSVADVLVDIDNIDSATSGSVIINQITLNGGYIDEEGNIGETPKTFIQAGQPLELTGLNRLNTQVVDTASVSGTTIKFDASAILNYSAMTASAYVASAPSIDKTALAEALFVDLPPEFDATTDLVLNAHDTWVANDLLGTVTIGGTINHINKNGLLLDTATNFTLVLSEFSHNITWNDQWKDANNNYTYPVPTTDLLQVQINDLTNETLTTFINNHKDILLNNNDLGSDTLSVTGFEVDANNPNAIIINAAIGENNLPPLTLDNLIFLPLKDVALKTTYTIDQFASEFTWGLNYNLADPVTNDPVEITQSELIDKLSQVLDGLDEVDLSNYTINVSTSAFNESGAIYLNLSFTDNESTLTYNINLTNPLEANKVGVSALNQTIVQDNTDNTLTELKTYLETEENFNTYITDLATNNDLIATYNDLSNVTFSHKGEIQIINDNLIEVSVYMKAAVDATNYFNPSNSQAPMFLGKLKITKENINLPTQVIKNYAYANDSKFINAKTPSQFIEVVEANKDNQEFLNLLVKVINPVDNATISISGTPTTDGVNVTYTFVVSQGYDENGVLTENLSFPITYQLLYENAQATSITKNNQLDGSKYAFEYTAEELAAVEGLVVNPVSGATTTATGLVWNNRNASVSATITVSDHQTLEDPNAGSLTEQNILFSNAKRVTDGPNKVKRNDTWVTETESEIKALIDANDETAIKAFVQKYIEVQGENYNLEWKVKEGSLKPYTGPASRSGSASESYLGAFEVEILLNNYFDDDLPMTYVNQWQTTGTKIYLYAVAIAPTIVIDTVAEDGIAATGNLAQATANQLTDPANETAAKELIQTWMHENFDSIFEHYPTPSGEFTKDVIKINTITPVDGQEDAVNVNLTLSGAMLPSGNTGDLNCEIKITGLTTSQEESQLKSEQLDITTLNISGITSETYAVDIYHGDAADNALVQAIVNNINENPNNYYVEGTAPSASEINDRPIINPDVPLTITPNEDGSTITINLEFLKRGENPNVPAVYAPGTITLGTFNTNLTTSTNSPIAVSGDLATKLPSQVEDDDIIDLLKQESTLTTAFDNYPQLFLTTNATALQIVGLEANNASGQLTVTVNVSNAYIGTSDTNNVNGIGPYNNATIVLNGFSTPGEITAAKPVVITDLTLEGITSDNYTIDFLQSTNAATWQETIKAAINDVNNINKFFVNAPNETQINGQAIVDPNTPLTFNYAKGQLTIDGKFLSTQQNPHDPAIYQPMTITISGFNTTNTALKANEYTITDNDALLQKLPSQVTDADLQSYLTTTKLPELLNNLPLSATIGTVTKGEFDDTAGTLQVSFTVNNAYTGQEPSGFGESDGFTLTLKLFATKIQQITGKTLSVTEAAAAGLDGLTSENYAIDFQNQFSGLLEDAFKNNLTSWFDNATGLSDILPTDQNFIQGTPTITFKDTTVTIEASVLGWNATLNPNEAPQATDVTVIITGFNANNTIANDYEITDNVALTNKLASQVQLTDLTSYLTFDKLKADILQNVPNAATLVNGSISIVENSANNTAGTLQVQLKINNAKINKTDANNGFGEATLNFTLSGFATPIQQVIGNTVSVTEATGFDGLTDQTYANDFTSQYTNDQIKNILNANMDTYFANTDGIEEKLEGRDFVQSVTVEVQEDGSIIINATVLGWNSLSLNPNDPLEEISVQVTINGFNTSVTEIKTDLTDCFYEITDDESLTNQLAGQVTEEELKNYFTFDKIKNEILQNVPESANLGSFEVTESNDQDGTVEITFTINNAYTGQAPTGYGDKEFIITVGTFTTPIQQIVGKTLTTAEAAQAGLTGLSNTIYAIDFEAEYAGALENAFKNNLTSWFENADGLSDKLADQKFIQGTPTIDYDDGTVTIAANVLAWNESLNPNDPLQSQPVIITITDFNITNTEALTTYNIGEIPALSTKLPSQVTPEDISTYFTLEQLKTDGILSNVPNAANLDSISIVSGTAVDENGTLDITLSINNAKVPVDGNNKGYSNKQFTVRLTNFTTPTQQIVANNLTVTEAAAAGLSGLNTDTFASDFTTLFNEDAIKNAINDNMSAWFSGTEGLADKLNGQSFVQNVGSITVNNDSVTINVTVLGWDTNPNADLVPFNTTITITGFNNNVTAITDANKIIDISNDETLPSMSADDSSLNTLLKDYVTNNKDTIFSNAPQNMVITSITNITPNVKEGTVSATINVDGAKLENGFGPTSFNVTFTGFRRDVEKTTGKTLTVDQAAAAGLDGLSGTDYSFDFESDFASRLESILNDANNLDKWLNNAPTPEEIAEFGFQSVVNGPLTITPSKDENGNPTVTITGSFISYPASGNLNDGLEYISQTITITGFNRTDTDTSNVNINNIANDIVLPGNENTVATAVDKLNGELKDSIKEALKETLKQNVTGTTSDFDAALDAAIDAGNFEFAVNGNDITLTVDNVPVVSENGTVLDENGSLSFNINTNNKFNNTNLNSSLKIDSIDSTASIFKDIFGSDTSPFYYDWVANNNVTDLQDTLKNYMNNNKDKFFKIDNLGNKDPAPYFNNIEVTNVTLTDNGDNGFDVSFTYTGYENGVLTEGLTGSFTINLKPTPSADDIEQVIIDEMNKVNDKYDFSNEAEREQAIGELVDNINDKLDQILPDNITSTDNGNRDFVTPEDFEYDKENNTITLPGGSINISGPNPDGFDGQPSLTLPSEDITINSKEVTPPSTTPEWVIYVIFSGWFLLLVLAIIFYEIYAGRRRRLTQEKLNNAR